MIDRIIKFRVWNDEQKKFEYFELHNITVPDRLLTQYKFPVQQYTGMKDNDGVEIYEGDIVKTIYSEFMEVHFCDQLGSFRLKNKEGLSFPLITYRFDENND